MAIHANPWQSPASPPAVEVRFAGGETVHWKGRRFVISASARPSTGYLLTEYAITLDTGERFSSNQLRLRERFEFEFEHEGRLVPALFETSGLLIGGETFRLCIDDRFESRCELSVDNWWKSQFAGLMLGTAIGGVVLVLTLLFPT